MKPSLTEGGMIMKNEKLLAETETFYLFSLHYKNSKVEETSRF